MTNDTDEFGFSIYVLTPTRRFWGYDSDLENACEAVIALVETHSYRHAEVWDACRPLFAAWRTVTNRVATTDFYR